VSSDIYASDPDARPDADFVRGELRHLVIGNRGRLLDARRTPITISAVMPDTGGFEVEIGAFEDAGAHWALPLEQVSQFQFARGGSVATPDRLAELERATARFDRELLIEPDARAREQTRHRIAAVRERIRGQLAGREFPQIDLADHISRREGDPRLYALLDEVMAARGLEEIEHGFSATFVSNPASGELVKGHAIVLAELGLCPFRGKIVRDPELFAGQWSKPRRAEHLMVRLAFAAELFSSWDIDTVTVYRGAAVDGPLPARSPASFVSGTLSQQVATSHFDGGPTTRTAVLWRQAVPITRLLMTFLETREMNERFHEAEVVLIADPDNRAF
jgi:hypothetical protein